MAILRHRKLFSKKTISNPSRSLMTGSAGLEIGYIRCSVSALSVPVQYVSAPAGPVLAEASLILAAAELMSAFSTSVSRWLLGPYFSSVPERLPAPFQHLLVVYIHLVALYQCSYLVRILGSHGETCWLCFAASWR